MLILILFGSVSGLKTVGWKGLGTKVLEQTVAEALPHVKAPYNIVLLSDDHDYKGMSYRYFFETSNLKPLGIDDYGDLATLVLIDEVKTENPTDVPIYELEAARGFALTNHFTVGDGPQVFILKKE
jgi:hypothetical protein